MRKNTQQLPPGQHATRNFPVLQKGGIVHIDRTEYKLVIDGLVQNPVTLSLDEIKNLGQRDETVDIHCVTTWTKYDMEWSGVPFKDIVDLVKPDPDAKFVIMYGADGGFTTSLPLDVMMDDDVLVAYGYQGKPISDDHGGPIRTLVPKKYFYKSAKWLVRLEFVKDDEPGYWERAGYSNTADPWNEERYD
ncbi:MAG TPA: molybdopterin-dependent oxidoreductase [Candidatus Lokiarchaeia archaeon]|nr:molybdopterin-dependent oxidoreductase [Candidatus Lokiarchaeia archaeon]